VVAPAGCGNGARSFFLHRAVLAAVGVGGLCGFGDAAVYVSDRCLRFSLRLSFCSDVVRVAALVIFLFLMGVGNAGARCPKGTRRAQSV
jgi:hypothetical protein